MIERDDADDVIVLRMAYGKANAMDYELSKALIETLDEIEAQDHRPIILTGSGRMFSAGVDLFRVVNEDSTYLDAFFPTLLDAFARLFSFPRPLVAAVNGHAIAGGCVLALACDYRIMTRGGGKVGVPELRVGVPFPSVAMEILRFAVGNAHLQAMVLGGDTVDTDEARRLGFIDELVDADALMDRAAKRAKQLAAIPARSYALSKRQLRQQALARIEQRSAKDDEAVRAAWMDPETLTHIRAYLDATIGKSG